MPILQVEIMGKPEALARAVGKACARPTENVHIFYDPPGEVRAAFGGELLEK